MSQVEPTGGHRADAGAGLVQMLRFVTVGFVVLSTITFAMAERLDTIYLVVCVVLFAAGTALTGLGLWNGIQRSRIEEITLTGLAAVDRSHVPAGVRNQLWGLIVVQIVVAVTFASLRPFTDQAFGILVPLFGLGVAMVWGSRFGVFHPRSDR